MTVKPVRMEFHISRQARDRYQFDQALFEFSGNVIFANFHAARVFAQKMNERRNLLNFPEQAVRAGQVNAMGLIDEILHMVLRQYQQQRNPIAMEQALDWVDREFTSEAVQKALLEFTRQFPPVSVYQRELNAEAYLEGESSLPDGTKVPNRQIALEEMLMLWLANLNPAFSPFIELFDDDRLEKHTAYSDMIDSLYNFFETQPPFGPEDQNLIDLLRAPALASPHSLSGQLEYIRTRWSAILGEYLYRLLSSLDLIKEEEKAIFLGPGPSRVYDFAMIEKEPERFSQDQEWMPKVVLLAKNSYVWLDQLSKKFGRNIYRLDQIPDEELDRLAQWGFTGLWLIGLWERSPASRKIKQMRGNPEAVASAYSIFAYDIAQDLGGEQAYRELQARAWRRGIRLASDMVPNHMGVDSPWVINHPERFISLPYSPFPTYSFNGPNLSWDDRVAIFLEDHYYNNTDAAVVFKRVDTWTGSEQYIYHGNDGTSMPWNDTAQLNYLNPETREAVIQTILDVARKFPIIRFDAAMTLAKRHYERLWFPQPGSGGDIPSRAEYSLTKEQFNQAFPEEFWREVVDRVAQEVPDTLLLAEAFWMMEGYFVRTLGMHRVYNSAFMNMLRDEKNQEYRLVVKNTLEFDPEILKRYVNFMNNPDERTAVDQFGKGDKYFGIAVMMVTMPGLPMFGHGQIEGYTEKYGMEYRRAYWDEKPDPYLVERHEREIFPLMRKRYLFSGVENFLLYDFFTSEGNVNEDVFAYSNRAGDERALVLYHNKYASTRGWIRMSAAYAVKGEGDELNLAQQTLAQGLNLQDDPNVYTIFRDQTTGLEYIRNNAELLRNGLYVELEAYKYHVFVDFQEVVDSEWRQYAQLSEYLSGRGVPSVQDTLQEILLQPIHRPYRELVNPGFFRWLIDNRSTEELIEPEHLEKALDEATQKLIPLLEEIRQLTEGTGDPKQIAQEIREELEILLALPALDRRFQLPHSRTAAASVIYLKNGLQTEDVLEKGDPLVWGTLLSWVFTRKLARAQGSIDHVEQSRAWIDEFQLGKIIAKTLQALGAEENRAWRAVGIIKLMTSHQDWCYASTPARDRAYEALQTWFRDAEFQAFTGVNRYQGRLWFNQESFEDILWWLYVNSLVDTLAARNRPDISEEDVASQMIGCFQIIKKLREAEQQSGFRVEKLLEAAGG